MQLPGSLVDSLDVVALLHECSYSVLKEGKGEVLQRANDVFYNKAQVRACPPGGSAAGGAGQPGARDGCSGDSRHLTPDSLVAHPGC